MEKFLEIVKTAVDREATDIHLVEHLEPLYRINRELVKNMDIEPMNRFDLESLMETLVDDSLALVEQFEQNKRLDLPYDLDDDVTAIASPAIKHDATKHIKIPNAIVGKFIVNSLSVL